MQRSVPPADVLVDAALVRRMLRAQHPDLAGLPLRRLPAGWDNEVFRLGGELSVRVPRRALGARLIVTEARWLPELAARLPLPVPAPVRQGEPSELYPWPWTVCTYVPGRPLGADRLCGPAGLRAADALADFLAALHVPASPQAPVNPWRGVPLAQRAASVSSALAAAPDELRPGLERTWARAVAAAEHDGPPVWVHGDLHGLNVLGRRGRICGVIDFGDLGAGDPATDLAVAWMVLDSGARQRLRRRVEAEDDTWDRAKGWAVLFGSMFLWHSRGAAVNESIGRSTIAEVLGET